MFGLGLGYWVLGIGLWLGLGLVIRFGVLGGIGFNLGSRLRLGLGLGTLLIQFTANAYSSCTSQHCQQPQW